MKTYSDDEIARITRNYCRSSIEFSDYQDQERRTDLHYEYNCMIRDISDDYVGDGLTDPMLGVEPPK